MDGFDTVLPSSDAPEFTLGPIPMWVVYDHPSDMPEQFVARKWLTDKHTEAFFLGETLEVLRAKLPQGLTRLARHPNDDPAIVEVWL